MMAAGRAAELGAAVVLLESTHRLGAKLRITGKGRCNLTNDCDVPTFLSHLAPNGAFMRNALARFFAADLTAFLRAHGVPTVTERGRRVFPASNDARDVVAALVRYVEEGGVAVRYDSPAAAILVTESRASAVRLADGATLAASAVILATGGLSYPGTGSRGDGYRMARMLGHTVAPLRPGLVPLVVREPFVARLQGLSLRNVRATLYRGEQELASEFGEMLFTHYGVSGPIILTLSSLASRWLPQEPLRLVLDLKPALDNAQLDARLRHDLAAMGKAGYHTLLKGLLPKSLIPVFAELSGIPAEQALSQFTAAQRQRVLALLKALELTVVDTRPIAEAIITLGGVPCEELDPITFESRLIPGLHFAGEIIDIAGDTGGYNLQIAFTTGRLAGEHAAHIAIAADG